MFPTIMRPRAVVVAAVSNWLCTGFVITGFTALENGFKGDDQKKDKIVC
jgi:hypothetical protein